MCSRVSFEPDGFTTLGLITPTHTLSFRPERSEGRKLLLLATKQQILASERRALQNAKGQELS